MLPLAELGLYQCTEFANKSGGEAKTVFTDGQISKAQHVFITLKSEELRLFRQFLIKL